MTEEKASQITNEWSDGSLSPKWNAALHLTDCIIQSPEKSIKYLDRELGDLFDASEITEISLGVALFHGFSKMLIALGREPNEMETTIIPTPTPSTNRLDKVFSADNPMHAVLSASKNLRDRWLDLEDALWETSSYPTSELQMIRSRLSELLPIPEACSRYYRSNTEDSSSVGIADQFFYDVRSITEKQRNEISQNYGPEGLVTLMICLALYDGAFRIISVLDY
ncbi:MAG: hypothetical protein CL501_02750 [Actinobacteria bacterium]|nr:hypothetical protein [Actinomycetota bacterium]MBD29450.1 hypothetical protein [Acidimicrobiaceae bacterium]